MSYDAVATGSCRTCPKCGGNRLKYQVRPAGTKGNAKYYRIHSGKSLIFPSWHKTYRSKREYKSVALCQNCGYCFEPYSEKGFLFYFFCLLMLPFFFGYLLYLFFTSNWFKVNKKKFFIITGTVIAGSWILMILLYFIGINLPPKTVESSPEGLQFTAYF